MSESLQTLFKSKLLFFFLLVPGGSHGECLCPRPARVRHVQCVAMSVWVSASRVATLVHHVASLERETGIHKTTVRVHLLK